MVNGSIPVDTQCAARPMLLFTCHEKSPTLIRVSRHLVLIGLLEPANSLRKYQGNRFRRAVSLLSEDKSLLPLVFRPIREIEFIPVSEGNQVRILLEAGLATSLGSAPLGKPQHVRHALHTSSQAAYGLAPLS